jgi:hypothetical protein
VRRIKVLPFSKPSYVGASRQAIVNAYVIDAVGLARDQVLGVVIDDQVALEQIHPTYSLALLPLADDVVISYEDALFYADCFAYEHEIPVIALPRGGQIDIEFLMDRRGKRATREAYFHELAVALESVNALRLGPMGYVEFRYDTSEYLSSTGDPVVRLNYSGRYGLAAQEVHLYSLALRQIDPLSEYLCYYRVIESASRSNGLGWLEQNLGRLESARFGMLSAGPGDPRKRRRVNLFTVLRRRAIARLRNLLNTMSYADIASRLYHTNRCGVAHGQSIRRADFSTDFRDVYLDGFVLKLMARLAIEDKLS